ncbi:NAD(P)/FAD-dependent oxidoreductase [Streptomyces mirabilis]|uniref:NAD(P)/FAD-dependent oxidoreductase n=1 Tax=Streptomyces mirabilis TaxID=68239 RepID=UPI000EB106B6|nr:FAD-binding oxidoreductase [Streptomyces mirabilis]MCX4438240.1 FAD-binding oxidoreductase [Streptomyces mirabilis]
MTGSARVVVIGGGVMGTSIAYHLARAGVPDVVLVERDELASGSTSRAAGGVRAQFSDELNIQLGARSLEAFARFGEEPGQDIGLRRVGYLFLLSTPEEVTAFEDGVRRQNALGVPSRLIDPAEARRLSPLITTDGLLAAAFSPDDGHCTPESVVQGYAAGARRYGATVLRHHEVTGIETRGDEITAVVTGQGRIATDTVVCAAGAWSRAVGAMVGVDLPVEPLRRQIAVTEAVPGLPPDLPMTIDFTTSLYFHSEGPGLLLGMSDPDEIPGFATTPHDRWIPRLSEAMERRAPALLDLRRTGGWAGLYEITPDHNALIGEARSCARFLYATGFSGHGFLQGPAVGEVIRDLYLGRVPFVDISPLSVERFTADAPRPEVNLV